MSHRPVLNCPSCGQENLDGFSLCPACGSKLITLPQATIGSFVGRLRETGVLEAALQTAMAGQGCAVMLVGEPGIGKTRTAQELASHATGLGAQVLWGACYEDEGTPPYWAWIQPIRNYVAQADPDRLRSEMGPGAADIAEIVPELRGKLPDLEPPPTLEPERARFRLFDSITTFLKNTIRSQPMLLVLDDLHWADRPSLLLLQFLARRLADSPMMLLGCYRDVELSRQHPLSETLSQLSREPVFRREILRGLSQEETSRFIETMAGATPSSGLIEAIYRHTEGNPFFMTEVLRLLREQGDLEPNTSGSRQGPGAPVFRIPEGVKDVIGQRLNRLSDQCNQVLTTASIIGREFNFRTLEAVSDRLDEDQLLEVIDEALESRMIEELPGAKDCYQFSHALVQEILADELSTSRRVRLHARVGAQLERIYGDLVEAHATELAYHFAEAEPVLGSEKLARYSLLAGEQALATYAYEDALEHFQRGLDAREGQPVGPEQAALLFGLGRAQAATLPRHEMPQAVSTLKQALDYYVGAGDVDRAVAVAEWPIPVLVGQSSGMAPLIARALELVPGDSHTAGRLQSRYGRVLSQESGDYEEAQRAFDRALVIAGRHADVKLEMRTLAYAAMNDGHQNKFAESLEKNLRAIRLAEQVDEPGAELQARWVAASMLRGSGDMALAQEQLAAMLNLSEKIRDRYWLSTALWSSSNLALQLGDWSAARYYGQRALEVQPADPRLLATLVYQEYEAGEFTRGREYLDQLLEVVRLTPPGPSMGYVFLAVLIPMVARITGEMDLLDVASAASEAVLSSPDARSRMATTARQGLAMQAVLRADVAMAEPLYQVFLPHQGETLAHSRILADRLLGLLAVTTGDLEQAKVHFEEARLFAVDAKLRPELAWTCHDYAEALLGQNRPGDRANALSLLEESLSIATELGMQPLRERDLALQERVESPTARPASSPDGLTRREMEVLRLVASGRTDREIAEELFIGVRTVSTHVSNILNKINAVNRVEATTYAARQGLV